MTVDDAYLDLAHLSKYAGLSVRTLRGYLAHPVFPLPHYRIAGGKVHVRRSEFDAWASRFRVSGSSRVEAIAADALKGV